MHFLIKYLFIYKNVKILKTKKNNTNTSIEKINTNTGK